MEKIFPVDCSWKPRYSSDKWSFRRPVMVHENTIGIYSVSIINVHLHDLSRSCI